MNAKVSISALVAFAWLASAANSAPQISAYGLNASDPAQPPGTPMAPITPMTPITPAPPPEALPAPTKPPDSPIAAVTDAPALPPGSVCSPWTGPGGTGCCGPVGGNGPILSELYARNGINLPVAGGIFHNVTGAGYMFSVGARSLFFNPVGSGAWTVDYGIDYIYNNGKNDKAEFDVFGQFVNIRETHRAGVHLAGGREMYLFAPAYQPGMNWRIGFDVGGRWGWERVNFNLIAEDPATAAVPIDFGRRGDVYGDVYVSFHTDFICPIDGCRSFIAGARVEWDYHFSDVLPTWNSDEQDVNIMLNVGIKF